MDEQILIRIAEFQERITNIDKELPNDWKMQVRILKNDLDEFNRETFAEASTDFKELDWRLNPTFAFGGGGDWRDALKEVQLYSEGLKLVEHRLRQGQSKLRESVAGEIVIDAGTPHSAYVKLREIIQGATTRVRLFDPYVGSDLFALLSNAASGVEVEVLTWKSKAPADFVSEAKKFTVEHAIPFEVRWGSEDFHDRFLLADDRLYMSGGSFKDLGKKLSYVTEVESVRATLKAELDSRWSKGTKA